MTDIGKIIILTGIILIVIGLFLSVGLKMPFLGRLPGDIYIKRDDFSFFFPITTSIVLSVLLTLIFRFFGR